MLRMVVLVPSNHMPLMALTQLGIWNKIQTTLTFKVIIEGALTSPRQYDPANQVQGWIRGKGQSGETPDQLNPIFKSPVLGVFIGFVGGGVGPLIETACVCMSHRLLTHVGWHSKPHQQ